MTAKNQRSIDKSGGVLIMIVVVMLVVTVMIMGLYKLQERAGVEVVYARQSKQAFWLAEAGLQDAIQRLNWQSGYRGNPTNFTANLGFGSYQVSVPTVERDIFAANPDTTNYTIVAVGTVKDFNRRVRQVVSSVPGSKFTLTAKGGSSSFNSNADVHNGGVAVFDDAGPASIDTGNNAGVNIGDLYTEPGVSVSGSGACHVYLDLYKWVPIHGTCLELRKTWRSDAAIGVARHRGRISNSGSRPLRSPG